MQVHSADHTHLLVSFQQSGLFDLATGEEESTVTWGWSPSKCKTKSSYCLIDVQPVLPKLLDMMLSTFTRPHDSHEAG